MGISIEIGSVVGSVASSLPAPAIDIGGHLGGSLGQGMDFLGSRMGLVNIGPVINEGPAGLSGLENTMTLMQAPKPSIPVEPTPLVFNPRLDFEPSEVQPLTEIPKTQAAYWYTDEPEIVRPAEVIMSQIEPEIVSAAPATNILKFPGSRQVISPDLEPATETRTSLGVQASAKLNTESRVSSQVIPALSIKPELEEEVEEEEVLMEKVKQEVTGVAEEEIGREQKFYLVDKRALTQRLTEIRQAFRQAKAEVEKAGDSGRNILGKLITKFMPLEHAGNRSAVIQPYGPDGSYEETKDAIEAGQFISEKQLEAVALANRPVEIGKEGEAVGNDEVWKVFKYRVVKPVSEVIEIVTIRRVKKSRQLAANQNPAPFMPEKPKPRLEPNLKDLNLEDVLQPKAA